MSGMKKQRSSHEPTTDLPPAWSIRPVVPLFLGLMIVIGGIMLYVVQDGPERTVAVNAPPADEAARRPKPPEPAKPNWEPRDTKPERRVPVPEPEESLIDRTPPPVETVRSVPEHAPPLPETPPPSPETVAAHVAEPPNDPKPTPPESSSEDSTRPSGDQAPDSAVSAGNDSGQPEGPQDPVPAVTPASAATNGPSIPDKATIAAKTKEIRQIFKDDYTTRDTAVRLALAQRLGRDAQSTVDDPTVAYVLATEARDQATQVGDYETFVAVGRFLTERYRIDTFDDDIVAFGKMPIATNKSTELYSGLIDEISSRVDDLCGRDDFERATRYANVAKVIATKASDPETAQEWTARVKEFATLKTQFGMYKAAKEALRVDPADATASAKWGTYLCLVRGDFTEGLPYLARGDDKTLAELAKRETNSNRNAAETVAMADIWWSYGERTKAFRPQAWRHASELYGAALPDLTGLAATKVEKRLADIASASAPPRAVLPPVVSALIASPWSVHWDRAPRPQDLEGFRRGNGNVDEDDWSRDETITFYEDGRVDSRYFDRYEIGADFIALRVPQEENPQAFAGPPGRQRDRRFHGRARFMGNELQFIIFRGERIDEPRNSGVGAHQQANEE